MTNAGEEIKIILSQLQDSYKGDPWFGRNMKALLREATEEIAFQKPAGQHSILELVWHMVTWREFTINRLGGDSRDLPYFETNDWRVLDHTDRKLWQQGLQKLDETQNELMDLLGKQQENVLNQIVEGREYSFRKLLYGIVQHDIYHLGQIAYLVKLLKN